MAASLPLPPPSAVPLETALLTWPLLELQKPAGASDPRTWGWRRAHGWGPSVSEGDTEAHKGRCFSPIKGLNRDKAPDSTLQLTMLTGDQPLPNSQPATFVQNHDARATCLPGLCTCCFCLNPLELTRHPYRLELKLEAGAWSLVHLRTEDGSQRPVLPPAVYITWPANTQPVASNMWLQSLL